jgi:putative sugar O-methyltransferase
MENKIELLDLMLGDQNAQPEIYRPGPYWREYQQRIRDAIRKNGIEKFRSDAMVGKGYADSPLIDASHVWPPGSWRGRLMLSMAKLPVVRSMLADQRKISIGQRKRAKQYIGAYYELNFGDWLREMITKYELPDTTKSGCIETIEIDGKEIATIYVNFLMNIYNYTQQVDFSKVTTMFEIGGGFGGNVHLLQSMFPNIRKVIYLDIPPMLYVGTQYLRQFYGDSIVDYSQNRSQEKICFKNDDSREILCICPWQIEKLDISADLFWNCASFSEMTPAIVGNYAKHIKRVLSPDGRVCLLLTIPVEDKRLGMEVAPVDDALQTFQPELNFKLLAPVVEHEKFLSYFLGVR